MRIRKRLLKDGRPSYVLCWELPHDPGTGKRRQQFETLHGTKREAERRWTAVQAEIERAGRGYVQPSREPLGDYLRGWLTKAESRLKPTTLESYHTLARVHIIPALGAVALADLTAPQVDTWQAGMLGKVTPRGTPISPKRVANARMFLHTALEDAVLLTPELVAGAG